MIQLLGLLLIIIALKLVVTHNVVVNNSPMAMSFNGLVAGIIVREEAANTSIATPAFA